MDKFFFVLGRYPSISLAEILAVLQKNNYKFEIILSSSEIAVFKIIPSTGLQKIFQILGGSIKLGQIKDETSLSQDQSKFAGFFEFPFLKKYLIPEGVGKIHFGVSIYDGGGAREITQKLIQNLKNFNITIKENLKKENLPSGFLKVKEKTLSSVAVVKNGLIEKGFELVLICAPEKIFVAKTLRVQDFSAFTIRDMERPKKDKKSGILPVKLARIMVNLLPETPQSILDPFCGSGTVLSEAALLGVRELIGSDINPRAVADTSANLDWLFRGYGLNKEDFRLDLKTADIRLLHKLTGDNITDAVVTEPFLGPPLFRQPDERKSRQLIEQLTPLYRDSLKEFYRLLKNRGNIVMAFPFIQSSGKNYFLDKNIIEKSRYKLLNSFLYSSPGQFVGREVIVLSKI